MADFVSSLKRMITELTAGTVKLGSFYRSGGIAADSDEYVVVDLALDDFGQGALVLDETTAKSIGNEMLKVFQLSVDNLRDELVLSTIGEAINQAVNGAVQESIQQFGGIPTVSVGAAQVMGKEELQSHIAGLQVIAIEGGLYLCVSERLASLLLGTDKATSVEGGAEASSRGMSHVEEVEFPVFKPEPAVEALPRNLELLLDVRVKVSVELGRTQMTLKELLSLGSGSIVTLEKLAGEPVDILVNGKPIAKGEVVVIDESFGVRILDIIAPKERLKG
ncbi:flagellar motor switch protein FliN [Coprothermobacteraceae bacterium]|nr:flagellar motor switch protein FliN [Coprothermobacteraceae bacterium]